MVGGATPEEHYDEDYVINNMAEQADMNLKYEPLFAEEKKRTDSKTKLHNNTTKTQDEQEKDQSQTNRIFEIVYNVNKTEQSKTFTSGQSDISTPNSSRKSTIDNNEKMNQENFYHMGATREIMEFIRPRNNSPEMRRLVEQRNKTGHTETPIRPPKPENNFRAIPTNKESR